MAKMKELYIEKMNEQKEKEQMNKNRFTKINLCDTCKYHIPSCAALDKDIKYGDGIGLDNVIKCDIYEKADIYKKKEAKYAK